MNEATIRIENVCRSYDGTAVLKNLNLEVRSGSIYGFLGRNGSGKTTTLRMLAGLIKPHTGTVRILEKDPFTIRAEDRQWLGYMSEKANLPAYCKVKSLLSFCRQLYPTWDAAMAEALLARYQLSPHKRFMTLSQGNQRLLSFILAIAPRPKVLLLDEPAANLDVVARREILDDILQLIRDCGCTVLFSTHILSDVERVADEIGILAHGNLQVSESLDSLKDTIRQIRFFGFTKGRPPEAQLPPHFRKSGGKDELVLTLRLTDCFAPETWAQNWSCQQETRPLNLEDIFVEVSRQ